MKTQSNLIILPLILVVTLVSRVFAGDKKASPSKSLECVMIPDTAAEGISSAEKTLWPCLITVSDRKADCMDYSNYEYPSVKQCWLVKEEGEDKFHEFHGKFEGIKFQPKKEYVLEVERFTTSAPGTDADLGQDKYVVKRVVKEIAK